MATSENVSPPVIGAWPVLAKAEAGVVRLIELIAAALVVVEVLVLSAGVFARYAWGEPLIWSDELASMLFLWLSIVGAVLAFHRGQHMRMGVIADAMPPVVRARLEVAALVFCLSVCVLLLPKATVYALHEVPVVTPAMEVSVAWRSFGLPIGLGLMLILGVTNALQRIRLS
ncbi:TRAP transporter small permease subunit, partial [Rhizobium jaguaris]